MSNIPKNDYYAACKSIAEKYAKLEGEENELIATTYLNKVTNWCDYHKDVHGILEIYAYNVINRYISFKDMVKLEEHKNHLNSIIMDSPSFVEKLNTHTLDLIWSQVVCDQIPYDLKSQFPGLGGRPEFEHLQECPFILGELRDMDFYPTKNRIYSFGLRFWRFEYHSGIPCEKDEDGKQIRKLEAKNANLASYHSKDFTIVYNLKKALAALKSQWMEHPEGASYYTDKWNNGTGETLVVNYQNTYGDYIQNTENIIKEFETRMKNYTKSVG